MWVNVIVKVIYGDKSSLSLFGDFFFAPIHILILFPFHSSKKSLEYNFCNWYTSVVLLVYNCGRENYIYRNLFPLYIFYIYVIGVEAKAPDTAHSSAQILLWLMTFCGSEWNVEFYHIQPIIKWHNNTHFTLLYSIYKHFTYTPLHSTFRFHPLVRLRVIQKNYPHVLGTIISFKKGHFWFYHQAIY